jgi:hypothetical protein
MLGGSTPLDSLPGAGVSSAAELVGSSSAGLVILVSPYVDDW